MDLDTFLTKEQKKKINSAVTKAEKKTQAEIVPVITDCSGRYDRSEDVFGLLLAVASVCGIWMYAQHVQVVEWGQVEYSYGLLPIVATIITGFIIGTSIASRVWAIRYLLTPHSEMKKCVAYGAQRAFHEFKLWKTTNSSGVLIYISLFERMVYVLGDKKVHKKFQQNDFEEIRDAIIQNLQKGQRCEALCEGIELCGEKLKANFPSNRSKKKNQLENHLRIFRTSY